MTPPVRTLPRLSRARLAGVDPARVELPPPGLLELPERAVQFGTGALLRGLVEWVLDEANRRGEFNGRVVMVASTGSGRERALRDQDALFTLVTQGLQDGAEVRTRRVVASASRALSAREDWDEVLALARSPELSLVFSNTTEVGIVLDEADAPGPGVPRSFPGKLTRFLWERASAFGHDPARGLVVLPCELIEDNGDTLRGIVLQLAERWGYGPEFAAWVRGAVTFCNTLVDRIVPGTPAGEARAAEEARLGYRDAMLVVAEPYRLFAIQGDAALAARLGFAGADPGVVVAPQIGPYRLRKVRLLNGGHSAMVPAALLLGHETVLDAVRDRRVDALLRRVVLEEVVPTLEVPGAAEFAQQVLDRFANPFVGHALADITLQQTTKLRVRVVPTILAHAARTGGPPPGLATAFAGYLLFERGDVQRRWAATGRAVPADETAGPVRRRWASLDSLDEGGLRALAADVCADAALWGTDLAAVPGFADAVGDALVVMVRDGVAAALDRL